MNDRTHDPGLSADRDEFDRLLDRAAHQTPADLDVEAALRKVRGRMSAVNARPLAAGRDQNERSLAWRVAVIAAAAAAFAGAVGLNMWRAKSSDFAPTGIGGDPGFVRVTGANQRDSTRLFDGTTVLMGPSSRLQVGAGFVEGRREVTLHGDANFRVTHNADHPFIVRAAGSVITDLGTVFDVHGDRDGVAVSVSSGTVRLAGESDTSGVLLRAGDHALRGASLALVRDAVGRWYGVHVESADASLDQRHVTASFSGETPDQVLNVLALALGARAEMRGDTAFLHPSSPGASRR